MLNKTKIGIATIALASFVVGAFAFSAYQVGAVGNGENHGFKLGFWRGGLGKIDIDSEEWQAKIEEWKTKMEELRNMSQEERKAEREELKECREELQTSIEELRNSEEWQEATNDERKEMMQELMEEKGCFSFSFPHWGIGFPFGLGNFKTCNDDINYEIVNIDNGIQITITSDDSEIVQKIQDLAARVGNDWCK